MLQSTTARVCVVREATAHRAEFARWQLRYRRPTTTSDGAHRGAAGPCAGHDGRASPASHQRRAHPPCTKAFLRRCRARRGRCPTAAGCSTYAEGFIDIVTAPRNYYCDTN